MAAGRTGCDIAGQAHLLVDLDPVAVAHDPQPGISRSAVRAAAM
jgi:hypothetical protein